MQLPKSIEADDREKVHLNCEVDGNPLEIIWLHDPIDRVSFKSIYKHKNIFKNNKIVYNFF